MMVVISCDNLIAFYDVHLFNQCLLIFHLVLFCAAHFAEKLAGIN